MIITILGEPASKSNSRRLIYTRGKPRIIKSAKALQYLSDIRLQVPKINPLLGGDLEMKIKIFYASKRPDLDPSLIFDGLQGLLYVNDRQIKKFTCDWALDRNRPRAEVEIIQLPIGWNNPVKGALVKKDG